MADEFELPATVIHHIQSLLTPKQAARTSILSKSWHAAWLTRPNLEFDDSDFEDIYRLGGLDELFEFLKKTFQRYAKSNQKIESLKLSLCCIERLSDEMIVKALRLGATHLDLCLTDGSEQKHILPHCVLESENLVGLAVAGYAIYDQLLDQTVRCSKLESLSLKDVEIKRRIISCVASTCPLIKNLSLCNVWEWDWTEWCPELIKNLSLCNVWEWDWTEWCPESVCDGLTNLPRLTSLVLRDVKVDALFLGDLSSKFPNLKDLNLQPYIFDGDLDEEMRISSCSLERLSLEFKHHGRHLKTVLDVPRIRKFEFNGFVVPDLGFQSASKELGESHITITCSDFRGLMFGEVSKLITELSQSKIYLSLNVRIKPSWLSDYEIEGFEGLPCRHQVEHLTVETDCHRPSLTSYAFFDGLFCICRPNLVTQHTFSVVDNSNSDFLSKILEQATQGKFSSPCNFLYCLHDLEEVHIQPVEEVHIQPVDEVYAVWRLLTRESWSDISALVYPHDVPKVRFRLKWRDLP